MNVKLISNPLISNSLAILRARETTTATFRQHAKIVSTVLVIEASKSFATKVKNIETPLAPMKCDVLNDNIVVVPVLRAGLAMLFSAQDLLLDVPVGFVGLERDERTAVAREYYQKFPLKLDGYRALILDPMLATGGSLDETIRAVKKRGCTEITLACIVAAPEGIKHVIDNHPEAILYTAATDDYLDDNKYIIPGLGDFGDRYFGT
jgi:uracil phosphoribosyltransferase